MTNVKEQNILIKNITDDLEFCKALEEVKETLNEATNTRAVKQAVIMLSRLKVRKMIELEAELKAKDLLIEALTKNLSAPTR